MDIFFSSAALISCLAIALSDQVSLPMVWIPLLLLALGIYGLLKSKKVIFRVLITYTCTILFCLLSLELALVVKHHDGTNWGHNFEPKHYADPHSVLGFSPKPNTQKKVSKLYKTRTIYDVVYTTENGRRITPKGNTDDSLVFFGGSYTFGEGVNDEESMPYVVGKQTGYTIFNFGFSGYGPHQMLAAIENNMVANTVENRPVKHIIYQAMLGHTRRVQGKTLFSNVGPRYVFGQDNIVVQDGFFNNYKGNWILKKTNNFLKKSKLYMVLRKQIVTSDTDLFLGIVGKTHTLLRQKYPNSTFHVIIWDGHTDNGQRHRKFIAITKSLEKHNIPYHLITEMIPNYEKHQQKYHIEIDGHPSALAHAEIASYVTNSIVNAKR